MKKNNPTSSQWPVRKVSLELKQKKEIEQNQAHRRVSLNYSENLKKRTAAIITQNRGMTDLLENESKLSKNKASKNASFYQKQKGVDSNNGATLPFYRLEEEKMPSYRFKTIELNPQAMTHSRGKQLEQNPIFSNYQTVNSKILEKTHSPRIQVEPSLSNKKRPLSSQYMGRTRTEISYVKKSRLMQASKKQMEKPKSNRLATDNINCIIGSQNELQTKPPQQRSKKEVLKTSEINLSNHFAKLNKDKLFGVPMCKKMTVSNINRYYQLCIKDLKNLQEIKIEKDLKRSKELKTEPIFDAKDLTKSQYEACPNYKVHWKYPGVSIRSLEKQEAFFQPDYKNEQGSKEVCFGNSSQKKIRKKPPLPEFKTKQLINRPDLDAIQIGAWENFAQEAHLFEQIS